MEKKRKLNNLNEPPIPLAYPLVPEYIKKFYKYKKKYHKYKKKYHIQSKRRDKGGKKILNIFLLVEFVLDRVNNTKVLVTK